jgi:hypothetical protein
MAGCILGLLQRTENARAAPEARTPDLASILTERSQRLRLLDCVVGRVERGR